VFPPPAVIDRAVPADPATLGRWRARLDALTRWCLADAGLAPSAAAVTDAARPTLGDLLRRSLARAGDGVVDLLDALDAPDEPAHRARLTRVLGGDVLLVVVTARGGVAAHAEARACRSAEEAETLVAAFLGGAVPPWLAGSGAHVRDGIAGPLLAAPLDDGPPPARHASLARLLGDPTVESTLVLPLLALEAHAIDAGPSAAPAPTVLGGVLRPGAAFLDAPAIGPFDPASTFGAAPALDEDEPPADDADDAPEDEDADDDDVPALILAEPAPPAFVRAAARPAAATDEADDADDTPAVPAAVVLERLRARQGGVGRVSVVVAADDGSAEYLGDAAPWLAEAGEQELRALARDGWTGDAAVELALAADDPEVIEVAREARRNQAELVVEIDGDEAEAWLRRHRAEVVEALDED
jgi:hypothetical protein